MSYTDRWLELGCVHRLKLKQRRRESAFLGWGGKSREGDQEKFGGQGLFSKVCCADSSPASSTGKRTPLPGAGEGKVFHNWKFTFSW